jgi:hypothetical protein
MDTLINAFCERNNLTLLSTHFLTHAGIEFTEETLPLALKKWEERGAPTGAITIEMETPIFQTRLWGEKMGDSLESYPIVRASRGEGREAEDLLIIEKPRRATNLINIIVVPFNEEGDRGLVTIYAGPLMPPVDRDPDKEWERNKLAYAPYEVDFL